MIPYKDKNGLIGFNTQPPEGGCIRFTIRVCHNNSFNTQPPEGGCRHLPPQGGRYRSFNTQPPEGGCPSSSSCSSFLLKFQHTAARRRLQPTFATLNNTERFQHTAARRRLHTFDVSSTLDKYVSTHSRPKAAAFRICAR